MTVSIYSFACTYCEISLLVHFMSDFQLFLLWIYTRPLNIDIIYGEVKYLNVYTLRHKKYPNLHGWGQLLTSYELIIELAFNC